HKCSCVTSTVLTHTASLKRGMASTPDQPTDEAIRREGGLCPPSPQTRVAEDPKKVSWRAQRAGLSSALSRLDLQDLELQRPARGCDLDGLALLLPDDRLPHRRLVRQLVLSGIRLRGTNDVVLEGLLRVDVTEPDLGADRDHVLRDVLLVDHARVAQPLLERRDPMLEQHLLVLRVVVLCVLGDVAELALDADPLRYLAALDGRELFDLVLELLVALGRENDFLHCLHPFLRKKRGATGAVAGANGSSTGGRRQHRPRVPFAALCR